jgi:hypothetical protein
MLQASQTSSPLMVTTIAPPPLMGAIVSARLRRTTITALAWWVPILETVPDALLESS